jgi:hypothetical protein
VRLRGKAAACGARRAARQGQRRRWLPECWGTNEPGEEEEGTMVISLGLKRENGGESLVLKEFVSLVSVLERRLNSVSNRVRC